MTREEACSTALSAANRIVHLLARVADLTDQLHAAARDARIDSIGTLVEARDAVCRQIGISSGDLQRTAAYLSAPGFPHSLPDALQSAVGHIEQLWENITVRQKDAESALNARLRECRTGLSSLANRKELTSAYRTGPMPTENSHFLDNRL